MPLNLTEDLSDRTLAEKIIEYNYKQRWAGLYLVFFITIIYKIVNSFETFYKTEI